MKDFLTLAKNRCSVRKYKPDPIPQKELNAVLEAARLAPTACNYAPQKIYAAVSTEALEKLAKLSPCTFGAPAVLVIGADTALAAKDIRRPGGTFAETDCTIAAAHIALAAADRGLGTCFVGMFNAAEVKAALSLPESVEVYHLMPIGYPAEDARPSRLHDQRRPLEEIVNYL